jgi:hypothetical protein
MLFPLARGGRSLSRQVEFVSFLARQQLCALRAAPLRLDYHRWRCWFVLCLPMCVYHVYSSQVTGPSSAPATLPSPAPSIAPAVVCPPPLWQAVLSTQPYRPARQPRCVLSGLQSDLHDHRGRMYSCLSSAQVLTPHQPVAGTYTPSALTISTPPAFLYSSCSHAYLWLQTKAMLFAGCGARAPAPSWQTSSPRALSSAAHTTPPLPRTQRKYQTCTCHWLRPRQRHC